MEEVTSQVFNEYINKHAENVICSGNIRAKITYIIVRKESCYDLVAFYSIGDNYMFGRISIHETAGCAIDSMATLLKNCKG